MVCAGRAPPSCRLRLQEQANAGKHQCASSRNALACGHVTALEALETTEGDIDKRSQTWHGWNRSVPFDAVNRRSPREGILLPILPFSKNFLL